MHPVNLVVPLAYLVGAAAAPGSLPQKPVAGNPPGDSSGDPCAKRRGMEEKQKRLLRAVNEGNAANDLNSRRAAEMYLRVYQLMEGKLAGSPELGCEFAEASAQAARLDASSHSSVGKPTSETPFTISLSPTAGESALPHTIRREPSVYACADLYATMDRLLGKMGNAVREKNGGSLSPDGEMVEALILEYHNTLQALPQLSDCLGAEWSEEDRCYLQLLIEQLQQIMNDRQAVSTKAKNDPLWQAWQSVIDRFANDLAPFPNPCGTEVSTQKPDSSSNDGSLASFNPTKASKLEHGPQYTIPAAPSSASWASATPTENHDEL